VARRAGSARRLGLGAGLCLAAAAPRDLAAQGARAGAAEAPLAPAAPDDAFGRALLDRALADRTLLDRPVHDGPCGPRAARGAGGDGRAADAGDAARALRGVASRPGVARPTVPQAPAPPRGYLGLRLSEVSEVRWAGGGRVVRYCAYPLVVSVEPASPAERAGVGAGDTLVALGARDLVRDGPVALDDLLVPGATLRVRLRRDGRAVTRTLVVAPPPVARGWAAGWGAAAGGTRDGAVRVRVFTRGRSAVGVTEAADGAGDAPPRGGPPAFDFALPGRGDAAGPAWMPRVQLVPRAGAAGPASALGPAALAGAQLVALDEDLREAVAGAPARGVFVLKVLPGTPAGDAGLRAGDVIVEAGGRAVSTTAGVQRALARGGGEVAMRVERAGVGRQVVLRW
jgi:serine protease Do